MKLKAPALKFNSGKAFFNEMLFTGTSLEFENDLLTAIKKYENGLPSGSLDDEYIKNPDGVLQVNGDILTSVDDDYPEPALLNDELFTGMAYYFEDDVCYEERSFQEGIMGSSVSYFEDGTLENLDLIGKNFSQEHNWYENGAVKSFLFVGRDKFSADVDFDQSGNVESVSISQSYFLDIQIFQREVKFNWMNADTLTTYGPCSKRLFLSGEGIGDFVFASLTAGQKCDGIEVLELFKTSITCKGLEDIVRWKSIQKLTLKSNSIDRADYDWIRSVKPECAVEFEIPQ